MFQYYDEERKVKSCEPVSIRDFISQPDGDVWGWFNEYFKYGGIPEIHDIVPYYELQENAKLMEYAESEKEKHLKRIAEGVCEYFCDFNHLYNHRDVKRFFRAVARSAGGTVSPYKLKCDLLNDEDSVSDLRDNTVKKYLELLCMNGIAYRVPVYDPKKAKFKINMSMYYFTDVGLAKAYNGRAYGKRQLYLSLICSELMKHDVSLYNAFYVTSQLGEDKKPHRATKSVDFVIVDENQVTVAIQVIPKYHTEEVKENCHAMKLLGPDCRKIIVTEPDEETVSKIRYNCPDNVDVTDIISFLGR